MKAKIIEVVYKLTTDGRTYYPREKGLLLDKDTVMIAVNGIEVRQMEYSVLHRGYFIDLDAGDNKALLTISKIAGISDDDELLQLIAENPRAADNIAALAHTEWLRGAIAHGHV